MNMGSPELFPATAMEIAATPTKPPAMVPAFELLSTVSVKVGKAEKESPKKRDD
jgi:hypothetical protein